MLQSRRQSYKKGEPNEKVCGKDWIVERNTDKKLSVVTLINNSSIT